MPVKHILFSFIIPHRENESVIKTKKQIDRVCCSSGLAGQYEIISVTGNQPSYQRNQAVKRAQGDFLYFLDNDSLLGEKSIQAALSLFRSGSAIAVVGGPSLTPDSDTFLQKIFGTVLSCRFAAGGKIRSRYSAVGKPRETDEYELILCNMIVRRTVFEAVGGFKENMYPNEENILINDIKDKGYKVYYHPAVVVYRSQRETLRHFIKQMLTYGRGRADETVEHPGTFNIFMLIPQGFSLYFLFLPVFIYFLHWYSLIPFFFYSITALIFSFFSALRLRHFFSFFILPFLFFIVHFFYGIGMLFGFMKHLLGIKKKSAPLHYKID